MSMSRILSSAPPTRWLRAPGTILPRTTGPLVGSGNSVCQTVERDPLVGSEINQV